ncbi:hypothetical protein [Streptomyces sp. NPDC051997]|jgi:hypothetical protein|uniref:hypothetical protein n=1 Tax=Streptomyces sp. NPDC051997 TaxID=3155611 RepID=UPI003446D65D
MATDYPYIQLFARTANDSTATVTIRVEEEAFGVDQQALVDAVKDVLAQQGDVTTMTATRYEMNVVSTPM